MHRENFRERVLVPKQVYARVTAGVVTGPQWAVVIDTLALPDETLGMRDFIEHELGVPVRYVINTHYHADHAWGSCFFPGATVIAHARCRDLLSERGLPSLEVARKQNAAFRQVKIVLPHLTFDSGQINLRVGKKNLILLPAAGHSEDGVAVLVEEDRVLFAGDAFMPLPYIVDGDVDEIASSIKKMGRMARKHPIHG
jgi:glyoxylase-like metal-dependent hydrolase (beta-lactamase superfamily II)